MTKKNCINDKDIERCSPNDHDGWIGERIEIIIPTTTKIFYHFMIPKPLYDYLQEVKKLIP